MDNFALLSCPEYLPIGYLIIIDYDKPSYILPPLIVLEELSLVELKDLHTF